MLETGYIDVEKPNSKDTCFKYAKAFWQCGTVSQNQR
jgi:hypothetical protein